MSITVEGVFDAVILPAERYVGTNEKGTIQFELPFEITAGEFAGERITAWLPLNSTIRQGGKNSGRTNREVNEETVRNIGWDGNWAEASEGRGLNGLKARIKVERNEYNGTVSYRVAFVWPAGGSFLKPLTPGQLAELSGRSAPQESGPEKDLPF